MPRSLPIIFDDANSRTIFNNAVLPNPFYGESPNKNVLIAMLSGQYDDQTEYVQLITGAPRYNFDPLARLKKIYGDDFQDEIKTRCSEHWIDPISHIMDCCGQFLEYANKTHNHVKGSVLLSSEVDDLYMTQCFLIYRQRDIVQQAFDDGNRTSLWLNVIFGLSNAALKKAFGRATWNRLLNLDSVQSGLVQALILNGVISMLKSVRNSNGDKYRYADNPFTQLYLLVENSNVKDLLIRSIKVLIESPREVLLNISISYPLNFYDIPAIEALNFYFSNSDHNKNRHTYIRYELQSIRDTINMFDEMGIRLNTPRWSRSRWNSEHDRITKLYSNKNFCTKPINWAKSAITQLESLEFDNEFFIPSTESEIAAIGLSQGHCLASYAGHVTSKNYFVVCIGSPNSIVACVGLKRRETEWCVDQIAGKFNTHVSAEAYKADIVKIESVLKALI